MQQRRLNTRFLVILTVAVGGTIVVLAFGVKYLFQTSAEKHIQMAELYRRENRLADAADAYKLAITRQRNDPELYVKLGDIYRELMRQDAAANGKDVDQYKMALLVDPAYLPAMQRLLERYMDEVPRVAYTRKTEVFTWVRDISARIVAIDPADMRAQEALHTSWLKSWMAGFETSSEQVDASMKALAALQLKDPANIEIPHTLAVAKMQRAGELAGQNRPEATVLVSEAEAAMQQAVEANPDKAIAHLRNEQVLLSISNFHKADAAKKSSYLKLAKGEIARAKELVKPEDPAYIEVNMAAAVFAQVERDRVRAEEIYREMLSQRPDEPVVCLNAAIFFGTIPAKRQEGISILEGTLSDSRSISGIRARGGKELEVQIYATLATLRMGVLAESKSEDEKKELADRIAQDLKEIYNRDGESAGYLKLKGRLCQVRGRYVEAIQLYNRAAAVYSQAGNQYDDQMMFQLALLYSNAQQTGEARTILTDLLKRRDDVELMPRILLSQILVSEGSLDDAEPHLKYLERVAPKDPQVVQLLLDVAALRKNTSRAAELLTRLPETTRDEIVTKGRLAVKTRQSDEANRLLLLALKQNPGDEEAALLQAQNLLQQNRLPDARKVLDAALAANPSSRTLKLNKAQLDGGGTELQRVISENLDEIKDDFDREMAHAQLAERQGNNDEALEHLKKAEQIKPEEPTGWNALFDYYLRRHEWAALAPYLDKLTKANHDKAGGLFYSFRLAMAKGDAPKSVDLAQQLTVKLPEFAQSWLALGQALQASRRYDEAREAFLRVQEKQAANIDAYRGLAECCYGLRRYDDAGRYIAEGRKRLPNSELLRQMEVEYELNYGQPEKVLGALEARLAAQPDQLPLWMMVGRAYERIMQRKATKGEADLAVWSDKVKTHWEKAFAKWNAEPDVASHLANAYLSVEKRAEAENVLQKLLDNAPDRSEPALLFADYHMQSNQPSHAEMILRKAIERMPKNDELWMRLAVVQQAVGKSDEALSTLGAAPQTDNVVMQKLTILLQAGKIAEAKQMIQEQIKAKGESYGLTNALAHIAIQENDLKSARGFAEKSLQLRADNPAALQYRALAKMKDSPADIDGAIIDFKSALQLAPQNADLHVAAAEAYMARRDVAGATREMESAVAIAPRSKMVWSRLMDLYLSTTPPRLEEAKTLVDQVRAAGGGADVDLAVRASRIAVLRQDGSAALAEMQRAVALSGNQPEVIRLYLFLQLDLGQNADAQRQAESLLPTLPDAWWIHYTLACVKAREGNKEASLASWDKALAVADKAKDENASLTIMQGLARELGISQAMPLVLQRAKEDVRWMAFGASLYRKDGDWRNAVALIEQAIAASEKASQDDQMGILQEAGIIYLAAQPVQAEKAIAIYAKVLQRHPDDMMALNNLACLYVDNLKPANPQRALEYSQRAYDLMQKSGLAEPMLMDTHGWVLTLAGRVPEGIELLQEVVQRKAFVDARYHLAEAYLRGKYADAAARQIKDAQNLIADSEKAGRPVSPELKANIQKCGEEAAKMLKEQTGGASNP